ncbi:hypothetical protein [Dyadobacter sp. LHD-138]|uniref:hypothetical protein n=1 Tax=Dyadobacter sp. LHD-138 TaxID=3071413 RepID=UPI0027DF41D6|nr:hypothetical protein [Dyadobacter sp. LHD-138]MDQ6481783.1 hypothetical protein [Dyadobacter sp. LHD-138]
MKVFTIDEDLSNEEIVHTLEQEFSSKFSYRFFGLGRNKSIVVRKSEFVGAQISKSGNKITVQGVSPNFAISLIDATLYGVIAGAFYSPLKKLEADLATFLKRKYS